MTTEHDVAMTNDLSSNEGQFEMLMDQIERPIGIVGEGLIFLKESCKEGAHRELAPVIQSMEENLRKAHALIESLRVSTRRISGLPRAVYFDLMECVQQVMASHDMLLLQKQLRYQISASADLPKAYANPEKILIVLTHLILNAIKYTNRGSLITIAIREVTLRQGAGVEFAITNAVADFTEKDRFRIFEMLYGVMPDKRGRGMGLTICREIIHDSHGQMWVDVPDKGKVSFVFVLPCVAIENIPDSDLNHTYKYDIQLANYSDLLMAYGADKMRVLLGKIEAVVRQLVRHPIDVVTSFEQSGIVSTIYETRRGAANSVASRISRQLGKEVYKIGKDDVTVDFRYHLSTLQ